MRKYVLVLILLVLAFNGMDNLRELTNLAIVTSIGIDITEDQKYLATAIVLDTSSKENSNKGIIYEAEGNTVQEAVRNIVDISPKKLYIGHLETLIISEEIAREKLMGTLDFFIRDNEGSNNFYLFVASGSNSKEVIKAINDSKESMKEKLLSSTRYKGNCNKDTLNDIIQDILKPGKDVLVNSCKIEDKNVKIENMAYFKSWNMQGFLNDQESIMLNILNNNIENTIITTENANRNIVSEVISSKCKMKLNKDIDTINIDIVMEANISETGKEITIQNKEEMNDAEILLEKIVKEKIEECIRKMKNGYSSDLIGIGNLLYRKKDSLFKDNDYLNKINILVNVDFKILNQGGVIKKW